MAMDATRLDRILGDIEDLTIAVVGDFGLDTYFQVDTDIHDVSVETGLSINEVVEVRSYPGGSGTVVSNLRAIGTGRVIAVGVIGADGAAFELRRSLAEIGVELDLLAEVASRPTPVYFKPMFRVGKKWVERSRFDVFPRTPPDSDVESALMSALSSAAGQADALVVSDYSEEGKAGVVTPAVRREVSRIAAQNPGMPVVVDSRLNLNGFNGVCLKPNQGELERAGGLAQDASNSVETLSGAGRGMARECGGAVFLTLGDQGLVVCQRDTSTHVPAFTVEGRTDIVGAGDTVLAALASALAAGASDLEAGLLGVLSSSITVERIGTTGVANADEIRNRLEEYIVRYPDIAKP